MRTILLSFFFSVVCGAAVLGSTKNPYDEDCEETLTHFSTMDSSIEKPLVKIFENNAFNILPVRSTRVDEVKLAHFYALIRNELLTANTLSPKLKNWIHLESALNNDIREGFINPDPPARILRETLQALVVTAVARDLLPYVEDQRTQYKLVFATLTFSQKTTPPKWKVNLRQISDPNSQHFIKNLGLTYYRTYYFLQHGPWFGRREVIDFEFLSLRPRAVKALTKYHVDKKLRPYVENTLGEYADAAIFNN